jgi:hypothetical protein
MESKLIWEQDADLVRHDFAGELLAVAVAAHGRR